jgi:hypothetical protein
MFLLVVVLPVLFSFGNTKTKRNMERQYNDQKKHGQAIQRPKETWTGNTMIKRNMVRQYNDKKKHGQTIQRHVSFGRYIACPCFFWSLYCLSMFPFVVVLPVHVSFGRCIICPCFFIQQPKETCKKHGQAIQLP